MKKVHADVEDRQCGNAAARLTVSILTCLNRNIKKYPRSSYNPRKSPKPPRSPRTTPLYRQVKHKHEAQASESTSLNGGATSTHSLALRACTTVEKGTGTEPADLTAGSESAVARSQSPFPLHRTDFGDPAGMIVDFFPIPGSNRESVEVERYWSGRPSLGKMRYWYVGTGRGTP